MSRPKRKQPPRVWYGQDKLRAAYYAGQGKSGKEIAQIIGGTDPARVRAMLNSHGIPLMRQAGSEDVLLIRWKRADREALNRTANRLDRDPGDLAALIVRKVLAADPSLLSELVHEFDVV